MKIIQSFVGFRLQYSVTLFFQLFLSCLKNSSFTHFKRHRWIKVQSQLTAKNPTPSPYANETIPASCIPVIPASQFDYHNESRYSLHNDINVKVEDTESKPNEDRQGNNNLWSFQEYSNRKFQISIPEETINTSSNWTHLKVFRENVEGEFVLHQFLMLSVWELKIFIQKLHEMLKEALQFEPSEVNAKLMIDET